jgi:hypothetical protein
MILEGLLCSIGKGVAALPRAVKALFVAAAIVALAHPDSRRWLVNRSVDVRGALTSAGQSLIELVGLLIALDSEAHAKANEYLATVSSMVKPQKRWVPRKQRGRRVRRLRKAGAITSIV